MKIWSTESVGLTAWKTLRRAWKRRTASTTGLSRSCPVYVCDPKIEKSSYDFPKKLERNDC